MTARWGGNVKNLAKPSPGSAAVNNPQSPSPITPDELAVLARRQIALAVPDLVEMAKARGSTGARARTLLRHLAAAVASNGAAAGRPVAPGVDAPQPSRPAQAAGKS